MSTIWSVAVLAATNSDPKGPVSCYDPYMKRRGNGSSISYLVNATHVTEDIWMLEFPAGTL